MTLPEPASDAKDESQPDTLAVQLTAEQEREARQLQIMDALSRGESYAEIQARFTCSSATIAAIAKRMADFESGAVAKLMSVKALDMINLWQDAAVNGAKTGKHAPAKDWLLHARVLDPVQSDSGSGAKVAVIIGAPGQPVTLPNVQVITSQSVSDETQD